MEKKGRYKNKGEWGFEESHLRAREGEGLCPFYQGKYFNMRLINFQLGIIWCWGCIPPPILSIHEV